MNPYFKYAKKVFNSCKSLSAETGTSTLWALLDYSWCFLRHGCLIEQYTRGHFSQMSEIVRRNSFTQRRLEKVIRRYNDPDYIHLLKNKNEFNEFFKNYVNREWLFAKTMTFDTFAALFKAANELFVKPLDDQEGHGVYKIGTRDVSCVDMFNDLKGRNVVVEAAIMQHEKLALGNKSVNSARILTVVDGLGKAHVIRAGLRAGVGDSVVDNYSAGGVLYEIDVDAGIIDHKGIQGENYNVIFHPGSDRCMLGYSLPDWDRAMDVVKNAAELIPQCRFVGWDVAFTTTGVELIEGNHNPGLFTLESLGTPGAYMETLAILKSYKGSVCK